MVNRLFFLPVILLITLTSQHAQQAPFSRGVNLTNWFQAAGPRQIQFTKYTRKDLEQIKSLGCDVIRLPINLHFMTDGAPDYTLDPLFLNFLDQVIDWTEALDLHLILDNHTFSPSENTDPQIGTILKKVWRQMAGHLVDRSELVYYEVLNEPHGISDGLWNSIQKEVVETIREVDTVHTIVIGPAGWNSYNNLNAMPVYEDDNLIYTFHFYDPFLFTHQGASWTNPSLGPLANVPFPYAADKMPAFPASLRGTWIESNFNQYSVHGTVARVNELIDIAVRFRDQRQVPVFCGEFGVYIPNSDPVERVNWYSLVRTYLEAKHIAWTSWDYHGGFGVFEAGSNGLFDHDLNIPLIEALGLNSPPQTPYQFLPDSAGFVVYDDAIAAGVYEAGYGQGTTDFYSKDQPNNGDRCIYWTGADQYNAIGFDFRPNKDLSRLVEENYALDLLIRAEGSPITIDIRFVDTKTAEPGDRPWRRRVVIDENLVPSDKKWHHLYIPLKNFIEHGAWDGAWYNPQGDFDWSAIDRLEIVSEHHPLPYQQLWFDHIQLTNMDTTTINDTTAFGGEVSPVLRLRNSIPITLAPNPVRDHLFISSPEVLQGRLEVFDPLGRLIHQQTFSRQTTLSTSSWLPGLYLIRIVDEEQRFGVRRVIRE